ncbi:MAG: TAXI family TRAP transporter solute-binding subunit [Hyphomicrobiaceae bacterium]
MRFWVRSCLSLVALIGVISGEAYSQSARERANRDTVGVIGGSVRGTYSRFAQDMANALDKEGQLRIIAQLGRGSQQNIADLLWLRGVDVAIVQSDVLTGVRGGLPGVKDIGGKIHYIMKLYNEEIHVLAAPGVIGLKELDGEKVSTGGKGSGTAMTAGIMFKSLGIEVQPVNMSNAEAVSAVRKGQIKAAVFVVGKPAAYFLDVAPDEGVSFIKIEIDRQLEDLGYLSSSLTATDYPSIIPKGQSVETIAVGAVLAAYNWKPTSSRNRRVKMFTERLITELPRLQRGGAFHKKWGDVDPLAVVPGWTRLKAAQEIVAR